MALAVSCFVMGDRHLAVLSGRDARLDPPVFKGFVIPVRIISTVRQHVFGGRKAVQQCPHADVIAPDQAEALPFFRPGLEAVRCVLGCVLSILACQSCRPDRPVPEASGRKCLYRSTNFIGYEESCAIHTLQAHHAYVSHCG